MNGDVQVFCKMWRMSLCLLLIVYLLLKHTAVVKSYCRHGEFLSCFSTFENSVTTFILHVGRP